MVESFRLVYISEQVFRFRFVREKRCSGEIRGSDFASESVSRRVMGWAFEEVVEDSLGVTFAAGAFGRVSSLDSV